MNTSSHAEIARQVFDLCRWTCGQGKNKISREMSLTKDLGFDTVKLVHFFADVEELYPGATLEKWFNDHGSSGRDTIDSAVYYLVKTLAPAAE